MDIVFEELKHEVETELGQPMDQAEEIEMKALYFFGKGVKLKSQLESEPEHIGTILPGLMADIKQRMERYRAGERKMRVLEATKDFLSGKSKQRERQKGRKRKVGQGKLW